MNGTRDTIFISYAREDSASRDELLKHLKVILGQPPAIPIFADSSIDVGEEWRDRIVGGMDRALIVVLLVSADLLTSEFVKTIEIPRAALAAKRADTVVACLYVRPCPAKSFQIHVDDPEGEGFDVRVTDYQGINDPSEPLMLFPEGAKRELLHAEAAGEIVRLAKAQISKIARKAQAEADRIAAERKVKKEAELLKAKKAAEKEAAEERQAQEAAARRTEKTASEPQPAATPPQGVLPRINSEGQVVSQEQPRSVRALDLPGKTVEPMGGESPALSTATAARGQLVKGWFQKRTSLQLAVAAVLVMAIAWVGYSQLGPPGDQSQLAADADPAGIADAYDLASQVAVAETLNRGLNPFILIEGGRFQMGSPEGVGDDYEHPQHWVELSSYDPPWVLWTPKKARECAGRCSWAHGSDDGSPRRSSRRRCGSVCGTTAASGRWLGSWT